MAKSQRLRLGEVRAVFRLVAECRELGYDARLWRQHLAEGLLHICTARLCTSGEGWGTPQDRLQRSALLVGAGFDAETAANFRKYQEDGMAVRDPAVRHAATLQAPRGTFASEELVGEREYFGSVVYNEYYRKTRCDFCLFSYHLMPDPSGMSNIALFRAPDMPRFDRHDRKLLDLVSVEVGRLLGGPLALAEDPGVSSLSPRLRQTLEALLEGDGEKQAALRLGISPRTVHEYVEALYRHFGVSSRAELMALFLRRLRGRPGP